MGESVEDSSPSMKVFLYLTSLVAGIGVPGVPVGVISGPEIYDQIPNSFQYGVADSYSGAHYAQGETADGAGNRNGEYTVNLPDGRLQRVRYHTNDLEGYVAEVLYDGHPAGYAGGIVGGVGVH